MISYPPEYAQAIRQASIDGEFRIQCTSVVEARNLRSNFYAYRTQLRRSTSELRALADSLRFEIDGDTLILSKTNILGVSAIRDALQTEAASQ